MPTRCSRPSSTARCAGSLPPARDGGGQPMAVARRPPERQPTGRSRSPPRDGRVPPLPTRVPTRTAHRWPFRRIDVRTAAEPRRRRSPVPLDGVQGARSRAWADDVGVISIDDPAHRARARRDPLRLPARALARLPDRRGEQGRRCSRATCRPPTTSCTRCEERLFEMGRRTVKLHQRARRRGADDDDRLAAGGGAALGGQDLAAQPQAGGAGGGARRHRHSAGTSCTGRSARTA